MGNHKSKVKKSKTQRGNLNNSDFMVNPDFTAYQNNNNSAMAPSSSNQASLFSYNKANTYSNPLPIKSVSFVPGQWFEITTNEINVGLGWDFDGTETYDLDASVTGFNECNELVEAIYYGHKNGLQGSVHHFGDNLTGAGEGDDEVISVKLNKVPSRVISLAVTVNSYKSNSLIKAKQAFIRLY